MKKIISIIIAASMVLTLLTGCGGSNQKEEAQQQENTAEAEAVEGAEDTAPEEAAQTEDAKTDTAQPDAGAAGDAAEDAVADVLENSDNYIVMVKDADDNTPIQGVMVQFCSLTQCKTGKTNAEGQAVFEEEPGTYTTHILRVPEGYESTEESLEMTQENRLAVYSLKKKDAAEGEAGEGAEGGPEAASQKEGDKHSDLWDFPMTGFTLTVPENFKTAKGQPHPADRGETDYGSEIYSGSIMYLGRTDEEQAAFQERMAGVEDITPEVQEETTKFYNYHNLDLVGLMALKKDKDPEEAAKALYNGAPFKASGEIGQEGDYKFWYFVIDYTDYLDLLREELGDELFEEFMSFYENTDAIVAGLTCKVPVRPVVAAEVGDVIEFETTDLDGNTVSSKELFAGHKVTMINIWATWCDPCKNELPELEKLSKELEEKGVQVIGICKDTDEGEKKIEAARKILADAGVTYTNLVATEEILKRLPTLSMPTTYFVDSEGRVLTFPVKGAYFDRYSVRIEEALQAVGN